MVPCICYVSISDNVRLGFTFNEKATQYWNIVQVSGIQIHLIFLHSLSCLLSLLTRVWISLSLFFYFSRVSETPMIILIQIVQCERWDRNEHNRYGNNHGSPPLLRCVYNMKASIHHPATYQCYNILQIYYFVTRVFYSTKHSKYLC